MAIKLVIFDCDGTLVDSEPISNKVLSASLNEIGILFTEEQSSREFVGLNWVDTIAKIEALSGKRLPQNFRDDVTTRRLAALKGSVREMPGASGAIEKILRYGYKVCVASSSEMPRVRLNLEETVLSRYFANNVFSATQVTRGKPNPDLFLFSAKQMGIIPEECAVIEDNSNGFDAGVAAGMRVFAYVPIGFVTLAKVITFKNFSDLPE